MTDIKEPTGIEGFRAWYRNHTGKMITRANAEKAVRSFASHPSPAPSMGRVTDAMVEDAFEGYLSVMGIPYEPGNPHPKVALRAALVAAIAALNSPPDHGGDQFWMPLPSPPTQESEDGR